MATLFEVLQFFTADGTSPLALGTVDWYAAGTTTHQTVWSDYAESAPYTSTITLNAEGQWPAGQVFIRGSYDLLVKDSAGNTRFSILGITEYNQWDFTGLTASVADLNSTTTSPRVVTAVDTISMTDRGKTLLVDATAASFAENLISASVAGNTFKFCIKKTDFTTNTVTITPFGGQTIDGAASKVLYDYGDFYELRSDGNNWLSETSQIRGTIVGQTTAFSISLGDIGKMFNCDCTAASFVITLPKCADVGKGFWFAAKKIDSSINIATLTPNGSETIDGNINYPLSSQNSFVMLKTDGNNWFVLTAVSSSSSFVTGMVLPSFNSTMPGWTFWREDRSIGDSSSGAVDANSDCKSLFILLWNVCNATLCPMFDSGGTPVGRSGDPLTDWNLHRRLRLPPNSGRSLAQPGGWLPEGIGIGGEPAHTQSTNELNYHAHGIPYWQYRNKNDSDNAGWAGQRIITSNYTGSSAPFNLYHPFFAMYFYIKK